MTDRDELLARLSAHGDVPWWAKVLIELLHPKPLDLSGLAVAVETVERIVQVARPAEPTKENAMSDQDSINAYVGRLSAATDSIKAEIQALKDQVAAGVPAAALDFTGLEAAVGGVEGLEPPAPAPVEPVPADVPPVA